MSEHSSEIGSVQVKICGLTRPRDAVRCAALGADAIGLIFYRKSPRYVSIREARAIADGLSGQSRLIGVFVNPDYDTVMKTVESCSLWGVQLHGQEPPGLIPRLRKTGLTVIKALFRNGTPSLSAAADYDPSAFLIESGVGALPGGNARAWDWSDARTVSDQYPVVLAGGLSEINAVGAAKGARADAVDVSSGVEERPGRKNLDQVATFLETMSRFTPSYQPRRIF